MEMRSGEEVKVQVEDRRSRRPEQRLVVNVFRAGAKHELHGWMGAGVLHRPPKASKLRDAERAASAAQPHFDLRVFCLRSLMRALRRRGGGGLSRRRRRERGTVALTTTRHRAGRSKSENDVTFLH